MNSPDSENIAQGQCPSKLIYSNLINATSLSLCSFYVTFVVQNHQLNHLPPADFYKIFLWASSEFCQHYTEKTSPVTLTVLLI